MRAPNEAFSYPYPHPAVTTDVVVFTIREGRLSTLLVKRANSPHKGDWALPGGFLDIDEDLDTCAARELAEETGLTGLYLEQLYTFGATHRDPRERVISVTYYALLPQDALATPRAASDAADVGWYDLRGPAATSPSTMRRSSTWHTAAWSPSSTIRPSRFSSCRRHSP